MDKIYHYTGLITFWLIVALATFVALWLLAALFWQKVWLPYRFHLWIVQVYEYLLFSRNVRRQKAVGYKDTNWNTVLHHLALTEGRVVGKEYRKHHLFQKRILAMLKEALRSDAAPEWAKKATKPIN